MTAIEEWARRRLPGRARETAHRLRDRRRLALAERVRLRCGGVIRGGPFAGMLYPAKHKTAAPKCLGTYEYELHDEVECFISAGYDRIINLGCAEGYYAVGLARRLPHARVLAVDYNQRELALYRTVAAANGISGDRIVFGFEASHGVIQAAVESKALIVADIEGWEVEVLDPDCTPALVACDMVVELHEHEAPGVEDTLRRRFSASHDIRAIDSIERSPCDWEGLPGLYARERLLVLQERPLSMRRLVLTRRGEA